MVLDEGCDIGGVTSWFDILVNNMCEQFNSCILDARSKPILTMLEWIREFIMKRPEKRRDKCEMLWEEKMICPKIRGILNKKMEESSNCMTIKSDHFTYEVSCFDVSSIYAQGLDVEDFVHSCYSVDTYNTVYNHYVVPMNGQELWSKTGYIPPLPPNFSKRERGRPTKRRIEGDGEKEKGGTKRRGVQSMPKQGFKVTCKFCKETEHNQKGCKWRKLADEFVEDLEQEDHGRNANNEDGDGGHDVPAGGGGSGKPTTWGGRTYKVLQPKKRKTITPDSVIGMVLEQVQ
ncbi:hypothetical protein ACS0TY_009619 [Phlomoides rotata]